MPKIPPYPQSFREEAVQLLRSSDRSISQLAKELGCSVQSLRNWSRVVIEDWRVDYNTQRPHAALGRKAPAVFAAAWTPKPAAV